MHSALFHETGINTFFLSLSLGFHCWNDHSCSKSTLSHSFSQFSFWCLLIIWKEVHIWGRSTLYVSSSESIVLYSVSDKVCRAFSSPPDWHRLLKTFHSVLEPLREKNDSFSGNPWFNIDRALEEILYCLFLLARKPYNCGRQGAERLCEGQWKTLDLSSQRL